MKKTLMFDADGTLFDYAQAEKSALSETFHHFGHGNDVEELIRGYKIINNDLWKAFEIGMVTIKELRVKRFIKLVRDFDLNVDPELFAKQYISYLGKCTYLLPDTLSVLKELKDRHTLVLITNGIAEVQKNRIKNSGLDSFFPTVIISEEAGYPKPDPGFFDYTFSMIGYPSKEDCLIIGDSLSSDIAGGNKYGVDSCWFNPSNEVNDTSFKPTWEISSLPELYALVR